MSAYLILIIAVGVLLVIVAGALFLVPRARRGSGAPPASPEATEAPPGEVRHAGAGDGGAATYEAPLVVDVPPTEALEKPPPSAGRMVRLRARLARSQTGFGSVLLGLLSRDALDDAAWEQIEDTLIAADVGVAPTRRASRSRRCARALQTASTS